MKYKISLYSALFIFAYIPSAISEQTYSASDYQEISFTGEAPSKIHKILDIDTSKNALEKAIAKFGLTGIEKGHHFYASACYGNKNYIKFEDVFAGSGYTISETPDQRTPCKITTQIPKRICNEFGVCLGDTKQQISKLFGREFIEDDITLRYSADTMHNGVPFTLDTIMIFKFKNNTLTKVSVSLSETN